jgi:DNA-binding SARP family transcriptional activator/Tfp pilus assembly protein PilF
MRWGILGPLQVADDAGTEIRLPAGRLRVLLAGLLTQANHAVPVDELVELVWDGAPPVRAARTVRVHVVRLRRALGSSAAARIVTQPPGYLCRAEEDELDVLRFEKLCRQARSAAREAAWPRAAALLTEALGLWRGAPLADVPSDLLRQRELPRLDRLRVQAIDDHVDAEMHLDRYEQLIPQLHDLIARYPLRERPPAQLMRVLARAGRRAEALEVYQDARRVLASELGIEPGPELRGLHERILAGDAEPAPPADAVPAYTAVATPAPGQLATTLDAPALATPAPSEPARVVPRELPMGVRDFTGRSGELRALTRLLDEFGDRVPGAPLISAIGGTAGVGKTALAVQWAHQVAGWFPDGQLYVNLRGFAPSGAPATPASAICGFLDALGIPPERIPSAPDAQAGLYRSLLADRKMLIVLDNARDEDQVRPLLPASPASLVLITSRNQLTGLAAADGARLMILDTLTHDEAVQLLTARLGEDRAAAEPGATSEIAALCAHLPLALAIAAARAAARPRFALTQLVAELHGAAGRLDALDAGDPTASVGAVFSWSYQQVSPQAARMFRLLGLHPGPDISVPAAASLAAACEPQARRLLGELTRDGLTTEHAPGRYAFHDLLRAYAAEQACGSDGDTAAGEVISRILDHYMHTAHAAALLLNPSREPLTLHPPRPGVTPEPLADHVQALAWFEAEHHVMTSAVTLAAQYGFDAYAWQLPWAVANFLDWRGHWHEWAATQRTAVAAATRLGDIAGQAAARRFLAHSCAKLADYDQARAHLTDCLALYHLLADLAGQAHVHQTLSWISAQQDQNADALGHAEQALVLFQATNDQPGQGEALNNVGCSHARLGDYRQAQTFCQQALSLYCMLGDRPGEASSWDSLGYAEHQLGNLDDAADCYGRALSIFGELGNRYYQADTLTHLGDTHHAAGEENKAQAAWRRALAILEDLHHPDATPLRTRLRQELGDMKPLGRGPLPGDQVGLLLWLAWLGFQPKGWRFAGSGLRASREACDRSR